MTKIEEFVKLITGRFDNKEQFDAMKKAGKTYPYAQHVNTVCNDKIKNLPADFKGMFIVEESYYENEGKRHASPHLFLITEKEDRILLSSYEIPNGEDKNTFSYEFMKEVEYIELKKSKKFTPALYYERNGAAQTLLPQPQILLSAFWSSFRSFSLPEFSSHKHSHKRYFYHNFIN